MNYIQFFNTLPIMAKGMLGIFIVTFIIICSIIILNKVFSKSDEKYDTIQ